ncbi:MAG: hypothetical protein IPO41_13725 [Acidobacteria bacterium]|nr:hypothetical protein [Acidobacteriota bacterium]
MDDESKAKTGVDAGFYRVSDGCKLLAGDACKPTTAMLKSFSTGSPKTPP